MAVSLVKGANISLDREVPGLNHIDIGLGWDARVTAGVDFDLDASAFLLGSSGKVRGDSDFIFFNNMVSSDGSVRHQGDNRTGDGDGDDEVISVELAKVPADVARLAVSVTIHEAEARGQNFGQVANAFIRIVDRATSKEITRYDLSEDYSIETAMVFGELYRHAGEWKFKAVGQGHAGGLGPLAASFGVNV